MERLWRDSSMILSAVVYVWGILWLPIECGGRGCEEAVERQLDGYVGCGERKGHFVMTYRVWRGRQWGDWGETTR